MKVGKMTYKCVKCGKAVRLDYIPTIQPMTGEFFEKLFDEKLCVDCYTTKSVDDLAALICDEARDHGRMIRGARGI